MGPEGYLPFFDRPSDIRRDNPPTSEPEPEQAPKNPHIQPQGELNPEICADAVAYMCEIRRRKPLWDNKRIIREARFRFDLLGEQWNTALAWEIRNGNVPPAKERPVTRKVIGQKSLRYFGGNPNADKRVPEKDDK